MNTSRVSLSLALFMVVGIAGAQSPADIGRGNMHFDAKDMDTDADGMISKDEMNRYSASMWRQMTPEGKPTIPVQQAAQDFSRGNLKFEARDMDADVDGQISKDEFMAYSNMKFDSMQKDSKNQISIVDAALSFGRGNVQLGEKSTIEKTDRQ